MPLPAQRPVPSNQNSREQEANVMAEIYSCADLKFDAKNQSQKLAEQCRAALSTAAKKGWLPQYPQTLLGMRGQELRSPSNYDNGKALMSTLTSEAVSPEIPNREYQCVSERQCDRRPMTRQEFFYSVGGPTVGRLPSQQPQRGLPTNVRNSAIHGYIDAWMSPERYTNDSSVAQKASEIRSKYPDAQREDAFKACLADTATIKDPRIANDPQLRDKLLKVECTKVGARSSIIEQADNPNVRYEGSDFIGAPRSTARQNNSQVGQTQQRRSGY